MFADLPPAPPAAEIIVTGRGLAAGLGDAAYAVTVIDRERLTANASGRIEDVLRDAAGFAQFRRSDSRSAHPTAQGATLRGLGGNASSRALVVLDGVPQSDPFGGYVSYAAFAPERLGAIRITRGGGTGAFGPGALAGTIELDSATAGELTPVWGGVAYGSRNSLDADAGVSTAVAGGFAFLSGGYAAGDGFTPVVAGRRGAADIPARYRQWTLSARAVVPVAPDTELQASGLAFDDRRTRGTAFTANRQQGADASVRLVGTGRFGWEALAYIQTRAFASGFASVDAARTAATATLDQYNVPATGIGGRIEVRPPVGERAQIRIGADTRATSGRTQEDFQYVAGRPTRLRAAGGETTTLGAFAEGSLTIAPQLTLTGGGRIDRWWIRNGSLVERTRGSGAILSDTRYADRDGWRPTGRAGLAFTPASAVTLRTAGYLAWRLPTLNELYRPFRAGADATAAEAGLKPERLKGIDGGIDYRPLPGWRASATVFANRLEDAVANVTVARGPGTFPQVGFVSAAGVFRRRGNIDAVESRGVEIEGAGRYGPFTLTASWAHVRARVEASGAALSLDGLRPAQTAKDQVSGTLAFAPAAGPFLSATVRHVGRQFEDDQNSLVLKPATTLDLVARLPLGRGVALEGRAENVTDTLVPATISSAGLIERATPRTLWIGLRIGT